LVIFETFLKMDDVGMLKGAMNLDLGVQLTGYKRIYSTGTAALHTFVFAFFVLSEFLVTTLHASLVPRTSLTSYTRANPPCSFISK
jgi:hypothetical protein